MSSLRSLHLSSSSRGQDPVYRGEFFLRYGTRGTNYQILVLLWKATKLLVKNPGVKFEARLEVKDRGILDDIAITIFDAEHRPTVVKAYQVKYFKHPIEPNYFDPNAPGDTDNKGKIHIGRLFEGFLAWKAAYPKVPSDRFQAIVYTNTCLSLKFPYSFSKGKSLPKKFKRDQRVFHVFSKTKLSKNFIEKGQTPAKKYSEEDKDLCREELENQGIVDAGGRLISNNLKSLQLSTKLRAQLNLDSNQLQQLILRVLGSTDLRKNWYTALWEYVEEQKEKNPSFKQLYPLDDQKKKALFQELLEALRFHQKKKNIPELEELILENIKQLLPNAPELAYIGLYYAFYHWFLEESGEDVPVLTSEKLQELLQATHSFHDAIWLQGISYANLIDVPKPIGSPVPRKKELKSLKTAVQKLGFVWVIGEKGIGKSSLVKRLFEKRFKGQYLFLKTEKLVENEDLKRRALTILSHSPAIRKVILDNAEVLADLPKVEAKAFLREFCINGCTVIVILQKEAQKQLIFRENKQDPNIVILESLPQAAIFEVYPFLSEYEDCQAIIEYARVPFYLNLILKINQNSKGVDLPKERAGIIKMVIDGKDSDDQKARQQTCRQIAFQQTLSQEDRRFEFDSKSIESLEKDGIIIDENRDNTKYRFSHNLFFEFSFMQYLNSKWDHAHVDGMIDFFWNKFSQYFTFPGGLNLQRKWMSANPQKFGGHLEVICHADYIENVVMEVIALILEQGSKQDIAIWGDSALHLAVYKEDEEAVRELFREEETEPNVLNRLGFSAFDLALATSNRKIVNLFLKELGSIGVQRFTQQLAIAYIETHDEGPFAMPGRVVQRFGESEEESVKEIRQELEDLIDVLGLDIGLNEHFEGIAYTNTAEAVDYYIEYAPQEYPFDREEVINNYQLISRIMNLSTWGREREWEELTQGQTEYTDALLEFVIKEGAWEDFNEELHAFITEDPARQKKVLNSERWSSKKSELKAIWQDGVSGFPLDSPQQVVSDSVPSSREKSAVGSDSSSKIDTCKYYTKNEIAKLLWLAPETVISDDMLEKVNAVSVYLYKNGYMLNGVKADGNCFCNAFLGSYRTLSRTIPLLNSADNQILFLRDQVAGIVEKKNIDRAEEIKTDKNWITAADEGELLAIALSIPIRVITVQNGDEGCGINDMLTFSKAKKPSQLWETITEKKKPKEYILIVDLGGHFIFANPLAQSNY